MIASAPDIVWIDSSSEAASSSPPSVNQDAIENGDNDEDDDENAAARAAEADVDAATICGASNLTDPRDSEPGMVHSAVQSHTTKLSIQHVARCHPEWVVTPRGQEWLEEINQKVDAGWFTSSVSLRCQPTSAASTCPFCGRLLLGEPPTFRSIMRPEPAPAHWHPLLEAVWENDISRLQILLEDPTKRRKINHGPKMGDGRGPLYHAVRNDLPDLAKLLLEARADPHQHVSHYPTTPGRPPVFTTPLGAIQERQKHMQQVFHEVFKAPPPPPVRCLP